ncbi:MAG: class I SAM-dependent methyltransferase [Patescibacteria group bacterium]|jgi:SAM-dependent methyltransferase|nr:class I SAM-dependent methyltransferase [Patescibacteria group bacterium]
MSTILAVPTVEVAVDPEIPDVTITMVEQCRPISTYTYERLRWLYVLTFPLSVALTLWVMGKKFLCLALGRPMPRINTIFFDGLGEECRQIKMGEASWKALHVIYNHVFKWGWRVDTFVDNYWIGMVNAQAVRNRFKLVKQEIRRAIMSVYDGAEVRIMSLACGSAQAIIEVMAEMKQKGIVVRAMLVDKDQDALDYAMQLANEHGLQDRVSVVCDTVSNVEFLAADFRPQIIEMLGLLDYLHQLKAIDLAAKIYRSLPDKGWFLTCNIAHNFEMWFLRWVINWPMIYRTPRQLAEVVLKAGFADCRLIYEPHRVHGLVVTQKV